MQLGPAFGQADLTNCERELIHLAGSVQPHGLLLALREPDLRIVQASANVNELLGVHVEGLLRQPVSELGGNLHDCIRRLCAEQRTLSEPTPLRCELPVAGQVRIFEGTLQRGAQSLRFSASIDAKPRVRGDLTVNAQRTDHEIIGRSQQVTLSIDANTWIEQLDVDALFALDSDGDGAIVIPPDSASYESIYQGMLSRSPLKFVWSANDAP